MAGGFAVAVVPTNGTEISFHGCVVSPLKGSGTLIISATILPWVENVAYGAAVFLNNFLLSELSLVSGSAPGFALRQVQTTLDPGTPSSFRKSWLIV